MMYWNGMGGWGIGFMTVSMLIFWTLVALGVVAVLRRTSRPGRHGPAAPPSPAPPQRSTPEQLLAERLARGEIDPDEYRARLDTLRGGDPPRRADSWRRS
ncbi:SHOCT domain-containing protein [Kitasatospora sp. NPDC048722]|uniref:SHOCT domain-containing protein n=1 Tax=Kitasatospora sp. NPDC048722 TaxID=3155639 RepID=UPI0033D0F60A